MEQRHKMLGKNRPSLLLVSHENKLEELLGAYAPKVCADADTALRILGERNVALLLIEMNVKGDIDGLIKRALEIDTNTQILLFSNEAEYAQALRGLEAGAALLLPRPCAGKHVTLSVERASSAWRQHLGLRRPSDANAAELPGSSPLTQALRERVLKLSVHDATVLISGEAGVGKSRLARFIHANSLRAQENFVAIDCAALSPSEIEIALFGVEGSGNIGALGVAAAGTLYLHDVDRLPSSIQERLLSAMMEKDFFSNWFFG